jgi:hypothetical protein
MLVLSLARGLSAWAPTTGSTTSCSRTMQRRSRVVANGNSHEPRSRTPPHGISMPLAFGARGRVPDLARGRQGGHARHRARRDSPQERRRSRCRQRLRRSCRPRCARSRTQRRRHRVAGFCCRAIADVLALAHRQHRAAGGRRFSPIQGPAVDQTAPTDKNELRSSVPSRSR